MSGVRLGGFVLRKQIGQGGMAEVWLAHRADGTLAAVKVLRSDRTHSPSYQRALRNEVRAAAGLRHDNIVLLLDYGEIPEEAEAASRGRLSAGSPWLAMEFVSGNSLLHRRTGVAWPILQGWLLELLSALAHAHARGVIHRDIKPANLLLTRSGAGASGAPRLRVTDFGLAYAEDWASNSTASAGTPAYMAPEQRSGQVRRYGPWTDLYAVGRTTMSLLTGSTTGNGLSSVQLPSGLEDWLRRLLAGEPSDRFQRAADAAHALRSLQGPLQWSDQPLSLSLSSMASSAESTMLLSFLATEAPASPAPEPPPPSVALPPIARPPLPVTPPPAAPPPPTGLRPGIRLAPLRRPPLTGRAALRASLWAQLQAVAADGSSRAIVLEGAAGVGKSRLARWLTESAAAAGGGQVFQARHAADQPPGVGLTGMLARALRCDGLRGLPLRQQLSERLSPLGITSAEELQATAALTSAAELAPFGTPAERHALTCRLLRALSGDRVVVVWLDDVQWDTLSLRFVADALSAAGPALLVLTVQSEALAEQPDAARALAALRSAGAVSTFSVPRLPPGEHRALVSAMLGQESDLVGKIAQKTDGNPLFAVQLIRDWVQRGDLQPGPAGLTLAPDAPQTIPNGLYAVWAGRLARLLPSEAARSALEIAAVLGMSVDAGEWARACTLAGVAVPPALVERMLEQRLAEVGGPPGWSFVHTMIRESLRRSAAERGQLARWHQACADALLDGPAGRAPAERVGRHLLAAGQPASAAPWLLEGARRRRTRGEWAPARALIDLHAAAGDALGWPGDDARRAPGWAVAARLAFIQGDTVAALDLAGRAGAFGAVLTRSVAARVQGRIAHREGRPDDAVRCFSEALSLAEEADSTQAQAHALQLLAGAYLGRRRTDEAEEAHRRALQVLDDSEPIQQAMNHYGLAGIALQRRDAAQAISHARAARDRYAEAGHRTGVATALNLLGEAHKRSGDAEQAAARYQESAERYHRLGMPDAAMPTANLGLLHLKADRFGQAREALEAALALLPGTRLERLATIFEVCLMPCDAADGRLADVAARLSKVEAHVRAGRRCPPEWQAAARQSAALLAADGEAALAARAQALG